MKCNNVSILNLSSYSLSEAETTLLEKGLTFVPTPKRSDPDIFMNTGEMFKRSLKLKVFFKNKTQSNTTVSPFTLKSTFNPPDSMMPTHIRNFIIDLDSLNKNFYPGKHFDDNLSATERSAISTLYNNKDIVISKSDKGSTIVIQDKTKYILETSSQLRNENTYSVLENNEDDKTIDLLRPQIDNLLASGFINKKEFNFFNTKMTEAVPRVLYGQPKIHKSRVDWFAQDIPKNRHIISDINSVHGWTVPGKR